MKKYRDFKEARKFVHFLKISSNEEWRQFCKSGRKPNDIPSTPARTYKKEWKGFGDWLGTGTIAPQKKKFRSFNEARKHVQTLSLQNHSEWIKYYKSKKLPSDIPTSPNRTYEKNGWISWGDWLGTNTIATYNVQYRSFNDARKFVQSLNLNNSNEWRQFCKSGRKPNDIPSTPARTYKKEWKGMGNFLGTGKVSSSKMNWRIFEDAREFVHSMNLKSRMEWREYCNSGDKPYDIPSSPDITYKKEWKRMGDWLGTGIISTKVKSKQWLPFNEAKTIMHNLAKQHNLKNSVDWKLFAKSDKLPKNIPTNPWAVYGKTKGIRNGKEI